MTCCVPFVCGTDLHVPGVARELQNEHPLIFGEHGGSSRVFSMTEVIYSLGMMLGPLLSGILFETIGFHLMTVVFGTWILSQNEIFLLD